jgi:hypothetical protein
MREGHKEHIENFNGKFSRGIFEDLGINGKRNLTEFKDVWCFRMGWIQLDQERVQYMGASASVVD